MRDCFLVKSSKIVLSQYFMKDVFRNSFIKVYSANSDAIITRALVSGKLVEPGVKNTTLKTGTSDAI